TVELGRFQREQRRVIAYADTPRLVLDATTAAEDRTFWDNAGVDVPSILSAVAESAAGERERGASTITQQLVRARLLPEGLVGPGEDRYLRKAKEVLQSLRLNDTYPGQEGKERVITAYLNEIFYGHDAYGIAAAAKVYFGKEPSTLTPAEAALLAGLPKSPSTLDPYRFATADTNGRLVVPPDAPPVVRRDYVLRGLADGGRWIKLKPGELKAALAEPVTLAGVPPVTLRGGQFTWQVRRQLLGILGPDVDLETGGYRVTTTLDWKAQELAQKWLTAAAIAPNLPRDESAAMLKEAGLTRADQRWVNDLRGKDLHNGALVAIDYLTGDVLAYVGSAGYTRDDLASKEFDPKFDAAGDGARQPGSAFKPILYASAFEAERLTPGSLLLDITTRFDRGKDWAPRDADQLERGPVLVRKALQYSLNLPTIRALERVGNAAVADSSEAFGLRFTGGRKAFMQAGLAGALGTVEVRPLDLTSAYGTLGNGGVRIPPRMVLEIRDPAGRIVWQAPRVEGTPAVSPATAFMISDILDGNTDPKQNAIWAAKLELRNGPAKSRRPAAVKTGTTNDARDLGTYGYLPRPAGSGVGLAVGVWLGNSDHSYPRTAKPATSLTAAAPLWRAFVRDYTEGWDAPIFEPPPDAVEVTVDAWSGGKPGPWTRDRTKEWFRIGTEPGTPGAIDADGLLYKKTCGTWRVDPLKAELGPADWDSDVADWLSRARRGTGVRGRLDSATAYFWEERSWGGPLINSCSPLQMWPILVLLGQERAAPPPRGVGTDRGGGGARPKPPRAEPAPQPKPKPDPTPTPKPDPPSSDPTPTPAP
nr:transglycosylase domain-containing protein [Chloroflexota bacterium]